MGDSGTRFGGDTIVVDTITVMSGSLGDVEFSAPGGVQLAFIRLTRDDWNPAPSVNARSGVVVVG